MLHQRQQQRFPPINKPHRLKFLQDVTQKPYGIGVVHYYPNDTEEVSKNDNDDNDYYEPDPGRGVIERNQKDRSKRIADNTKEELDRVLKRVDNTLNNYEYSVQSSLIQHGMPREEMNNVEQVADIRELEYLLNDSLAKQRYKQRLMVFIVGQTEHATEKAKLLQQVGQFFLEQKQNFSGAEFNDYDDTGDTHDEIEATLKSFDVKDCYLHVKTLGNRINELNEDIIQFLIQNTGTKQTKVMVERGKRKLAQVTKEAKEQLADLQSKIEMINAEMMAKDGKIQTLEKDIETIRAEAKTGHESQKKIQDELKRRETEIKFFKRRNNELEDMVNRYRNQMGELPAYTSATSQSETEDGDDASRTNLETIDETESRYEKESISSRTGREPVQPTTTTAPPLTTEPATNNATKPAPPVPTAPAPAASKGTKKSKTREKNRRTSFRSKKEAANQNGEEDPSEIYRRSQQLLESLLADKSENAPDLNALFKPQRGVDLNNVTIDNLPTAFTNIRKFAITRVRELLKELETKESENKETVQVLKQEFVEHKTKYEKERLLYFLTLDPDESSLQEEQNALLEKADHAHKLQIKAQKTAEDALNHLQLFMVEQEKLDQQDVVRQTELVHRHSIVLNNMTGSNINPPDYTDPIEELQNDRLSPNPKGSTPLKSQWRKLSGIGNSPTPAETTDQTKSNMFETAQTLKRLSSNLRKTPPPNKTSRSDSIEQQQQSSTPPTTLLRRTTQELLRKKSSTEQLQQDQSPSSSRRISGAINDDTNPVSKIATPQPFERTSSMQSRSVTRSNSINPANKDQDKLSSGERSYHTSAAQSRRVSIVLNRSPVRAEELERVLTTLVNEEVEAFENFRRTSVKSRTSLREKYMSLLEEKKHELDDLKQQADVALSRPTTSKKERKPFESLDNSAGLIKQRSSSSPLDISAPASNKGTPPVIIKYDQQQQTSLRDSRPESAEKEKSPSRVQIIHNDQYKVPFFHLYETIYKFRHSIINLLSKNEFVSLADRLDMDKQLSPTENNPTNDFVDNSERVLKDTVKILQTCMETLTSTMDKNKENQSNMSTIDNQQSSNIQQKESIIDDLNNKYQQITEILDENNKKSKEELTQNERTIADQQKLIQNFQQELMRLQKRLSKIESEGIVQPSIMFTRLDAERNEQTLKQAVEKGNVSETTYNEINDTMEDYISLPCRQFSNIVKRYIQHRKAIELKVRVQNETFDNETQSVMEKMGSYYEQRSGQISEHIASIRQHRSTLARTLTDKFDHLEHDNSIFLIRPVYSYQGRTAAQSYMENEKRQQKSPSKENENKKKYHHNRHTESTNENYRNISDDDEKLFDIDKSFTPTKTKPASHESVEDTNGNVNTQLSELSRLQEVDIQRTLMPVSHNSVPLSSVNSNNGIDSSVNLRTYVPLSRPGMSGNKKTNDVSNPILITEISNLSVTNSRAPLNLTVNDIRQASPPLPPIKSSVTSSTSQSVDESKTKREQNNELATTNRIVTDNDNQEK